MDASLIEGRKRMRVILALAVIVLASAPKAGMPDLLQRFPGKLATGVITNKACAYNAKTIYDYMDGGADPYLRFDFQRLYAAEYAAGQTVVVEAYDMGSSAEAYGIFSTDASGEAVKVGQGAVFKGPMLHCWKGRFFIKIAGEKDTRQFREFARKMAVHLTAGMSQGTLPDLVSALPKEVLRPTQIRYLHTYDDLSNAYYISTENVLALAKGRTDVLFADCRLRGQPLKVVVVRYRKPQDPARALGLFTRAIFSRKAVSRKGGTRFEEVQKNQFTGVRAFSGPNREAMLAICFEARTANACVEALAAIVNRKAGAGNPVATIGG